MDSQRFRAQAFHRHVIHVNASYTEVLIDISENTLYTFEKGRAIQGMQIPPKDF